MSDKKPYRLFKPSSWLVKINFINHLVLLNNILVAVLAEPNGGKSSFIALLQQGLDKNIQCLIFSATNWFFSNELLAKLCVACQIEPDTTTTIGSIIQQVNAQKKHFLLIIDDAHYLPVSFLEDLLTEIASYSEGNFFHCCLVANSSLHAHLSMLDRECFANSIHTIPLGSLTERETKTWVMKKMPTVKRSKKVLVDDFYQLTKGNIAAINQRISHFNQEKTTSLVSLAKGCIAGFALLAVSFWCWQNINLTHYKIVPQQLVSHIPSLTIASLSRPMQASIVELAVEKDADAQDNLAIIDKVIMMPKSMYRHQTDKPAYLLSSLVPVGVLLPKHSLLAAPKTVEFNKYDFTIQLLASKSKQQIAYFVRQHHLNAQTQVHLLKRDGNRWYVLTTGKFAHHHDAERAIKSLPLELAKLNPWIRSAANISVLDKL